jgi:hypothetical protein
VKYLCLLAALLLLPVTADAQQEQRRGSGERRPADRGAESRGQRHSGNPNTTGLSPMGLPPAPQRPVPWWEQREMPWWEKQNAAAKAGMAPWQYTPTMLELQQRAHNNRGNYYRPGNGYIYVVPSYGYFPYTLPGTTEAYVTPPAPTEVVVPRPVEPLPPPAPPPPPIGVLRLEVEPRSLIQIFVDGVYIGTPADVGDELGLSPGVRHIELRAPGFISKSFDTDIVVDRAITYRAQLERDANAPPPPAPIVTRPGSRTMYVIPGCYMGNVAPTQANLRPGCDMSKLTTIEP